ncbi:MAG: folate-binding protein [Neisseria sp.]|nr:folate-binding protein [Neisseria sp.]
MQQTSRLPFFAAIRASGDDRATFLHGQLSNHIEGLACGQACYATYNTPKGRVIANMLVFDRGDDILLLLAADLAEAVCKRLRMFVLRAKVEFEILADYAVAGRLDEGLLPKPAEESALSFPFTHKDGVIECPLPHGGTILAGEAGRLPDYHPGGENAWKLHEILSGYPWICAATKETCVAQMLNQHTIGGIHFKKGCYPGQEVIARAQYRGQVKRGLAALSCGGMEAEGITVKQDGAEAGIIINTADTAEGSMNLAVIKHSAAQAALTDADGTPMQQRWLFFDLPAAQ